MGVLSFVLIALTVLLHLGFLVLEMFLWMKPEGRAVFRMTPERAEATRVLAANQGSITDFWPRASSGRSSRRTRFSPSN
ncbi:hypothetical protein EKH55_0528 [Sinorhizobium alkalisoli]|nr:hypothetical protein EKH55_0528 [Sinorhizobium alkalisoli]